MNPLNSLVTTVYISPSVARSTPEREAVFVIQGSCQTYFLFFCLSSLSSYAV